MKYLPILNFARGRSGIAHWLIQPAKGWHHKKRGMTQNGLFLPLAVIGIASLSSIGINAWIVLLGGFVPPQLVLQSILLWLAFLTLLTIPIVIYHNLVAPLFHLRHWAQRVRGGNLAARIPVPIKGEFAELARDVNALTEQLQRLTLEMQDEVKLQTRRMEEKSRTLEVLYDVAASINVSRDLEDLLVRFLERLKVTLGARAATVRLLTPDNQMRLVANLGFAPNHTHCRDTLPLGRCVCGKVLGEGVIKWKMNSNECGRVYADPEETGSVTDDPPAMLAIPLQHQDRTLGVYSLFLDDWPEDLNEDLSNLLTSIGRHLGMAIEKARLDAEARRLSIVEERNQFAHELHDSLAQTLASLGFRVDALEEQLGTNPEQPVRREVTAIKETLARATGELRELISQFRVPMDKRGLLPAVEKVIQEFREVTGVNVFLQKDWDPPNLPETMETEILRIVQESLANVRKHADAQMVRVLLRANHDGCFHVMVEDDGKGFAGGPREAGPGEHIGLSVMCERAAHLNGELRVESEPGEGTRVTLEFEYPRSQPMAFVPARAEVGGR